jgi:AcrR family transcriptional regulator
MSEHNATSSCNAAERGPRRPPGRGRNLRAAVLAATLNELAERGYASLTVDNVARRAGVHKTSLYRHWPDRQALVLDALTTSVAESMPVPDTGEVATDLREYARSLVRWLTSPIGQAVVATTISDAVRVPEIGVLERRFYDDRFQRAEPIVIRAIERGELPIDTDPAEVIKTMIAPIYLRLLITAEPIDQTIADRAAQLAVTAAQAGILRRSASMPRRH